MHTAFSMCLFDEINVNRANDDDDNDSSAMQWNKDRLRWHEFSIATAMYDIKSPKKIS